MEDLNEELLFLKSNRTRVRAKCTRKTNVVKSTYSNFSEIETSIAIEELKEFKSKLETFDTDIHRLMHKLSVKVDELNNDYDTWDNYEENLQEVLGLLQGHLAGRVSPTAAAATGMPNTPVSLGTGTPTPPGQIKLPQVPLPEYNHAEGESFEHFITNFESVLDKYNISNFEKYVYLERQLKGEALLLIRSLRGDQRSYDEAKKLLMKAFASPTVQRFDILTKLANLKLKPNGNCYAFL